MYKDWGTRSGVRTGVCRLRIFEVLSMYEDWCIHEDWCMHEDWCLRTNYMRTGMYEGWSMHFLLYSSMFKRRYICL